MKLLFVSNLYPNSRAPHQAPYNRQLMEALAQSIEVRVVAPFYWFPGRFTLRGQTAPPDMETLGGIPVTHPRCFYTPGILIHHHWRLYRASVARHLKHRIATFSPDHVLAGFLYPDAAAVLALARGWNVPCSVRVNGSDFRLRIRQPRFRKTILQTLHAARAVFCPGRALQRDIVAAGIEAGKVFAFNNGVDHERFRVRSREAAVSELLSRMDTANGPGIKPITRAERPRRREAVARLRDGARCVLYVGHLRRIKGPDRLLRAFGSLCANSPDKDTILVLIGDGDLAAALRRQAGRLGLNQRVFFAGSRPHEEIALWMNAADCLCLPSRSEGMPNVVLEALASGLPVAATDAGEAPFLIQDGVNGFRCRNAGGQKPVEELLTQAMQQILDQAWDRDAVAASVAHMTWPRAAEVILQGLSQEATV